MRPLISLAGSVVRVGTPLDDRVFELAPEQYVSALFKDSFQQKVACCCSVLMTLPRINKATIPKQKSNVHVDGFMCGLRRNDDGRVVALIIDANQVIFQSYSPTALNLSPG